MRERGLCIFLRLFLPPAVFQSFSKPKLFQNRPKSNHFFFCVFTSRWEKKQKTLDFFEEISSVQKKVAIFANSRESEVGDLYGLY